MTTHNRRTAACTLALAFLAVFTLNGQANGALLGVDFQNSNGISVPGVTQPGFVAFDNTHSTGTGGSATYGAISVGLSGLQTLNASIEGLFNRGGVANGGGLTHADVYNDFAFNNNASTITLELSGAGISANTPYDLTFYSFDPLATDDHNHVVKFASASGTTGQSVAINTQPNINPTTNGQYAVTGTFVSNGAGVVTIEVADAGPSHINWGPRLNALEVDLAAGAPPSPGGLMLNVDFDDTLSGGGPSPTETGFNSFQELGSPGNRAFNTPNGALIVRVGGHDTQTVGGFFDRAAPSDSGAFTFGELYRDFLFRNDGGTMSMEIEGVLPDTEYEVTFYSSDFFSGAGTDVTNEFRPVGDTSGATGQVMFNTSVAATDDLQHSFTGIFQSTTDTLSFEIANLAGNFTRLNGFQLRAVVAPVPEPSTATLAAWGLLGLAATWRRKN